VRWVVRPVANRAVVTAFHHTVRVVPLVVAAIGRPFVRHTPIDQQPRQPPPQPRPPSIPATPCVAHQDKPFSSARAQTFRQREAFAELACWC
jgi:hypothetical protein